MLLYLSLLPNKEGGLVKSHGSISLKVDPKTGEVLDDTSQFSLARFLFALHYKLNMSRFGAYVVGVVTLFFLFALFSGIYIHAKKIIPNFFAYRLRKRRTQLLDLHNVVGVISLPYTLMYAITGLIFNLVVVYQISFAILLYQGDTDRLLGDVGFPSVRPDPIASVVQDMAPASDFLARTEATHGPVHQLRFFHYGDETAVVQLRGTYPDRFVGSFSTFYHVKSGEELLHTGVSDNHYRQGTAFLYSLHFGDFAGIDLRILYFILAMLVAAMIVAGNLLWVEKRIRSPEVHGKATHIVSAFTLGGCAGSVVATAVAFMAERSLPANLMHRADYVVYLFVSVLVITTLLAFWRNNKKQFLGQLLYLTATILCATVVMDWLLFAETIQLLWQRGDMAVVGMELGLLLFAGCFFWGGRRLNDVGKSARQQFVTSEG